MMVPASPAQAMLKTIAAASTRPSFWLWNQSPATTPMMTAKITAFIAFTITSLPTARAMLLPGEIAGGKRAHGHRHRLHAGIAAHGGDDRHQHRERDDLLDRRVELRDHGAAMIVLISVTNSQRSARQAVSSAEAWKFALADAAQAHQVFLRLFLDHMHHVVDGDHAHQPAGLVHHRRRHQGVLPEHVGDLFLVHIHRGSSRSSVSMMSVSLTGALVAHGPRQRHPADRRVLGIDDEEIVEIVGQVARWRAGSRWSRPTVQ